MRPAPRAVDFVSGAQHGRRMDGRENALGQRRFHEPASALRDLETFAQQRPRRDGAQAHQHPGPDDSDLGIHPGPARGDLGGAGRLVDAAFAARLPFEVLHDVCQVHLVAFDPRLGERAIQEPARRPDEDVPFDIFDVAGLLAHHHHGGAAGALAEDGLRPARVEVAGAASGCRRAQRRQGHPSRQDRRHRRANRRIRRRPCRRSRTSMRDPLSHRAPRLPSARAPRPAGPPPSPCGAPSTPRSPRDPRLFPMATARLRRKRRTPARFIALPFSIARSSSSDRRHRASSAGCRAPAVPPTPDPSSPLA